MALTRMMLKSSAFLGSSREPRARVGSRWEKCEQVTCCTVAPRRLTASRGAARPAKASIAPNSTPGWPGSVEDPRPHRGCFALYAPSGAPRGQGATPFGAHPGCTRRGARRGEGAKRSGGGSIELLGGIRRERREPGSLDSMALESCPTDAYNR